ncbi:MAG: phage holin family protein [Verrucomicrobiota bacterium]
MNKPDSIGGWFRSWILIALGVFLAAWTSDGIQFENNVSLLLAVLMISVLNVVLRPILILLTLPFVFLTLGLGIIIINALLFWLAGSIVPGFEVAGFWSALWGAIVVGFTSLIVNLFLGGTKVKVQRYNGNRRSIGGKRDRGDDDVIDV